MEPIRVCTFDGPGAQPVIRTVPWPKIPKKAALIKVGACGVCGTDLHILRGHWPKPLPWPFTLGHEIGGVLVEVGSEFSEDFMSKPLTVGSKVMIPPLMPCGHCYYCIHYPQSANKCALCSTGFALSAAIREATFSGLIRTVTGDCGSSGGSSYCTCFLCFARTLMKE